MNSSDRFDDPEHIRWAKEIKIRDNFECQICFRKGVKLNSHHLFNYADYEDLRFEESNGICLCVDCHKIYHLVYGKNHNSKQQFEQFKQTAQLFLDSLKREYDV